MSKLKIGIALQVVVLIACIIGFALPWYQIKQYEQDIPIFGGKTDEFNAYFRWKNVQCVQDGEEVFKKNYDEGSLCGGIYSTFEFDDVAKIFNTCLSFLTIGAGLALGTALLQVVILVSPKLCRSFIWKVLCIGCAMATIALLFVAFFTLLGLPKALDDDVIACPNNDEEDGGWCDKIYGKTDKYLWIPGGGWWATLGACFTALIAGLFTLVSNR